MSKDDPRMNGIKAGFKEHMGFDVGKPLYCVIDPAGIGEDNDWVRMFKEDPTQAENAFSDPNTLMSLVEQFGAIVVDGAHRW